MKKRLVEKAARVEKEEITLVGIMTSVWKKSSSKLGCEIGYLDRFSRGFFPILASNWGHYSSYSLRLLPST